jgi:hypothetical protein
VNGSAGKTGDTAPKLDDDAEACSEKIAWGKDDAYAGGESGAYSGNASSSSLAVPFSWYIWQYAGTWLGPDGMDCKELSRKGDGSNDRG